MSEQTTNETSNANENVAPMPEAPKLSRREKLVESYNKKIARLDELRAEIAEIVNEVNSIDALASIDVGSAVLVSIGKGETAAQVPGVVIGVRVEDDGSKTYKVQYGSGFDADIAVVKSGRIALPLAEPEVQAEAQA